MYSLRVDEIENCKRELKEETWYFSEEIEFLWESIIENYFEWKVLYYIAKNCKKITNQNLDEWWEIINIKEMEWNEFLNFIASNDFKVKEFALEALKMVYNWKEDELKNIILW